MHQLFATFGINWKLLLAQAVNFGILLGILWYFLYQPVMQMLDTRRKRIAEGVEKAKAADLRLDEAKAEGERMVGEAAREAEGLVATARTRAEERGSEILQAAEERAAATLRDATARADEARRQALKASEKEIARAAVLAAEKILREKSA